MSREYNVFELQDAIASGHLVKTMKIALIMAEQKDYSIIPLIAMLAGYYTRLYAVKSLPSADEGALAEAIGIKNPFVVKKHKAAASKYTLSTLERIIGWLHIYDMKSKGWSYRGGDDRALTIELIGKIMRPDEEPAFADSGS
jgi:DNA polymerase-3 subunit delta